MHRTLLMAVATVMALGAFEGITGVGAAGNATGLPGLERLKALEGTWIELGDDGAPTGKVISVFEVTAGGNAVMETLFPGTDHEMVTLYHKEGESLALTHYCVTGNHPHMRAVRDAGPDRLAFECDGRRTTKGEKAAHMHEGIITIIDADRIDTEWRQFVNGKNDYTASFRLVRRKD